MELDLCWMRKPGRDPLRYFAGHPRRFELVHVKDMAADGAMGVDAGTEDWRTLLRAARTAGVTESFVEHGDPTDGLAFARTSWAYLQHLAP
jgi:sugar phosphate isomerase/epimerase